MKIYTKTIIKILFIAFCTIILFFINAVIKEYNGIKQNLHKSIEADFEEAIKRSVEEKCREEYFHYSGYTYNLENKKIGEFVDRQAHFQDTILCYSVEVVDMATDLFRGQQTFLLNIKKLYPADIQTVFDSILHNKDIFVDSAIKITASYYTKLNECSKDTTAMHIKHIAPFTGQGEYKDINYYAYIDYPFSTVWKLMNKTDIYTLLVTGLLILIILSFYLRKRKQERVNHIVKTEDGNYRIGDMYIDMQNKKLVLENKEETLGKISFELLTMFLQAEDHKVNKEDIKNTFWAKSVSSTNSMTSAIGTLNEKLNAMECRYSIVTDKDNGRFYAFTIQKNRRMK